MVAYLPTLGWICHGKFNDQMKWVDHSWTKKGSGRILPWFLRGKNIYVYIITENSSLREIRILVVLNRCCFHLLTCPLAGLGCVCTLPSSQHRAFRSNLIYYGCFGFLTIARLWPYTGFVTGNKYENIFRSQRKIEVVVITLDMQSALLKMSSVIFFFFPSRCPYFCIKKGLSLWIGCQIYLFLFLFFSVGGNYSIIKGCT